MPRVTQWRIETAYLGTAAIAALVSIASIVLLRLVTEGSERVISEHAHNALLAENLRTYSEAKSRAARGFLISGDAKNLENLDRFRSAFREHLDALRASMGATAQVEPQLNHVRALDDELAALTQRAVDSRKHGDMDRVFTEFGDGMSTARERLDDALDALASTEMGNLDAAERRNRSRERLALGVAVAGLVMTLGVAALLAALLTRARQKSDLYLSVVERSNEDLEAFAGRIAHDFKNLLSPIKLTAASLTRQVPTAESNRKSAERIERTLARATHLMDGLLAFSRAAHAPPPSGPTSVREGVSDVMDELSSLAARVNAQLTVDIQDVQVCCDSGLLHLVLLNLVSNGLKFMEGCARRALTVRAWTQRDHVRIEVRDTGPGIPADALPHVFEPFYRAYGTRNVAGTGIGLATVKRIVEACHGSVEIRSEIGSGTTVLVTLSGAPRVQAEEHRPADSP
jgi:signal transduction histidine kinase